MQNAATDHYTANNHVLHDIPARAASTTRRRSPKQRPPKKRSGLPKGGSQTSSTEIFSLRPNTALAERMVGPARTRPQRYDQPGGLQVPGDVVEILAFRLHPVL